jgi:hypothetical protein
MNPPRTHIYDPENAAALVKFAAAAYVVGRRSSGAGSAGAQPCQIIENQATDTLAVIYSSETDLVIAFRGTQDLRNWLTDLDARMVKTDFGRVHAGFWNAWCSVRKQVSAMVDHKKRVWFTGHSLGGALAMIAAANFALPPDANIAGVYTFGQPRAANASWRDAYHHDLDGGLRGRTFRVIHNLDIVPHVPWLLGRYQHCGHEAFYGAGCAGAQPCQVDRPFSQYALADLATALSVWRRGPLQIEQWLADHHVSRYQALFTPEAQASGLSQPASGRVALPFPDPFPFNTKP